MKTKKFYYALYVALGKESYSVAIESNKELSLHEAIEKASNEDKFDDEGDIEYIEDFYPLSEKDYKNFP